jgi:H+-translocating NAD(P) transhydrogenase subunit alpha
MRHRALRAAAYPSLAVRSARAAAPAAYADRPCVSRSRGAPSPAGRKCARILRCAFLSLAVLAAPHAALAAGGSGVSPLVYQFMVFVIAIFVGYYVVWSVTPALHTPLMSVTNAISSVIVVGALLAVGVGLAGSDTGPLWARALGLVALTFASVNIFGGFLVTQRMLAMYQKKKN